MPEIVPRKTVVEVRFPARLKFFQRMDAIGEALLTEMHDSGWSRKPNSLDVNDRKHRERVSLEFRRFFTDFDSGTDRQKDAVARGIKLLRVALTELGLGHVDRIGIRQWFAVEVSGSDEEKLFRKLLASYLKVQDIEKAAKMSTRDMALTLELIDKVNPQKESRIIFGAMDRQQWLDHVAYPEQGDSSHLGRNGVAEIVEALPTAFVFIDIDKRFRGQESDGGLDWEKAAEFATTVEADQKTVALQILKNIREVP